MSKITEEILTEIVKGLFQIFLFIAFSVGGRVLIDSNNVRNALDGFNYGWVSAILAMLTWDFIEKRIERKINNE
jgi:hypothetical protein